jgi:hypothetical protein
MSQQFQVIRVSNEGSSSPFIARLFITMMEFRDQLFLLDVEEPQKHILKSHFDEQYRPMYEAALAARDAAIKVKELIGSHLVDIENGKLVRYGPNQFAILDSINIPLSQAVDQLIDQSFIATKVGLQSILRDPLQLDICFFFKDDKFFEKGISDLFVSGESDLAKYLKIVRKNWHSKLRDLRVDHEHKGWSLGNIEYRLIEQNKIEVILPKVLDMNVNEFAQKTTNRVLLFIENMMIFALQRYCNRFPIYVVEIPKEFRDPKKPLRFSLAAKGLDNSPPWVISYLEEMDFV